MRIAIVGVGAMGCLFAARLSPLADVHLLGTWPEQLAALQREGLTLVETDGRVSHHRVSAGSDPGLSAPADLVLILVKSHQTARAAKWAGQAMAADGIALTLQNGLGNLETMKAVLGPDPTALGITSQGAAIIEPGRVRHAGPGPTHLALTPFTADKLLQTAHLFNRAGLETHLASNVAGLIWGKLAINTGINPLTALLDVPNGFLVENETAGKLMIRAALETAVVAREMGITLPFPDAGARVLEVAKATAANYSSMLQDIRRGAPTEIDAICGPVVANGRRLVVPTQVNQTLFKMVKKLENNGREEKGDPYYRLQTLTEILFPGEFN